VPELAEAAEETEASGDAEEGAVAGGGESVALRGGLDCRARRRKRRAGKGVGEGVRDVCLSYDDAPSLSSIRQDSLNLAGPVMLQCGAGGGVEDEAGVVGRGRSGGKADVPAWHVDRAHTHTTRPVSMSQRRSHQSGCVSNIGFVTPAT